MSTSLPRLLIVARASSADAVAAFASGIARSARASGLDACALTVGSDREVPSVRATNELRSATAREVHRIDPALMPIPSIQSLLRRVGEGLDLTLVLAAEPLDEESHLDAATLDVMASIDAPLVVCVDAEDDAFKSASVVRTMAEAVLAVSRHCEAPLPLLAEAAGGRRAPGIEEVLQTNVLSAPPRSARSGRVQIATEDLARLIMRARSAPLLPPPIAHKRRSARARIGVAIDRCFDLYDEESLVQFEVSGAEFVPLSLLEGDGRAFRGLDGLLIGDGRIEAHSTALAKAAAVRTAVRALVEAGTPTIACGGGLAYLSRGLRTHTGSLHPMAGAIDAEAKMVQGSLRGGHAEIELLVDALIGRAGTRLRGFVQRSWLLRGLPPAERGVYRMVSGTPDEGVGRLSLFGTHLRPYWPSCPGATAAFIDRCAWFAAARDGAPPTEDGAPRQASGGSEGTR